MFSITVTNRGDAELFHSDHLWGAISISTSPDWFPSLSSQNRVGLLQLSFDDIDFIDNGFSYGKTKAKLFSQKDALSIINFVDSIKNKVSNLLIHCEAGISRSPAVAATITRFVLDDDDSEYFRRYCPNMLVYRTLAEEYNRAK